MEAFGSARWERSSPRDAASAASAAPQGAPCHPWVRQRACLAPLRLVPKFCWCPGLLSHDRRRPSHQGRSLQLPPLQMAPTPPPGLLPVRPGSPSASGATRCRAAPWPAGGAGLLGGDGARARLPPRRGHGTCSEQVLMKRTAARLSSDGGDPTPVLPAETVSVGLECPCPASPAPRAPALRGLRGRR